MLPDSTVRYADHHDAVVDLHLPGEPAGRIVVLLHGGFWKAEWDRRHTRPMAAELARQGWIVATPEYRRVGGGGGWPVTAQDVHLAVSRLPELLAGLDVPVSPLTVTGHSAGGHLALWLTTTGLSVERVVALAPVCDLREAIRLGLGDNATQAFLGDGDLSEADPMVLLGERPTADLVIVHGADDDVVPVSLSRRLVAAHPSVTLHALPGVGHMELIDPRSSAWPHVVEALAASP